MSVPSVWGNPLSLPPSWWKTLCFSHPFAVQTQMVEQVLFDHKTRTVRLHVLLYLLSRTRKSTHETSTVHVQPTFKSSIPAGIDTDPGLSSKRTEPQEIRNRSSCEKAKASIPWSCSFASAGCAGPRGPQQKLATVVFEGLRSRTKIHFRMGKGLPPSSWPTKVSCKLPTKCCVFVHTLFGRTSLCWEDIFENTSTRQRVN